MPTINLHILKKVIENAIEDYLSSKSIIIKDIQMDLETFLINEADTDFIPSEMAEDVSINIYNNIIKNSILKYHPPILNNYCKVCGGTRNGYWFSTTSGISILEDDLKNKSVIISDIE